MGWFTKDGKLDAIRLSLVGFLSLFLVVNHGLGNHLGHEKRAIIHRKERCACKIGDGDFIGGYSTVFNWEYHVCDFRVERVTRIAPFRCRGRINHCHFTVYIFAIFDEGSEFTRGV